MSQEIWDQGRVVGYSSYEIYLKKHFEKYPDIDPPSEEQWLASSLAMGQSMIVSVPNTSDTPTSYWEIIKTDGDYKVMDLYFSEKFKMVAANNIIGSFFSGTVQLHDSSKFASWVASYGPLVGNENTIYPTGTKGEKDAVDPRASVATSDTMKGMLTDYMKILDAVIIQPGTWRTTGTPRPKTELKPDFTEKPRLRLLIKGEITTSPKILLTGFSYASQVAGVSKDNGAVNTSNRANGDFLGPEVFPWCSKVTLTVPTLYTEIANSQPGPTPEEYHPPGYTRKLPSGASSFVEVPCEAFNDFVEYDSLKSYMNTYQSNHQAIADPAYVSPVVDMTVGSSFTSHDNYQLSGLTIYSKDSQFPPALYAHKISSSGGTKLCPIDSPAVGSVKVITKDMIYNNNDREAYAKAYFKAYPGVVVYYMDDHNRLFKIVRNYKGNTDVTLTDGGRELPEGVSSITQINGGDVYSRGSYDIPSMVAEFIWTSDSCWKRLAGDTLGSSTAIPVSQLSNHSADNTADWDYKGQSDEDTTYLYRYFRKVNLNPTDTSLQAGLARLQTSTIRSGDGRTKVLSFEQVDENGNQISSSGNSAYNIPISTCPEFSYYTRNNITSGPASNRVISTSEISINHENLTWGMLLVALANDVSIDILGNSLKQLKWTLTDGNPGKPSDAQDSGSPYIEFGPFTDTVYDGSEIITHDAAIAGARYRGLTYTQLTDGSTTTTLTMHNPVNVNQPVTLTDLQPGDGVLAGLGANAKAYIWNGARWSKVADDKWCMYVHPSGFGRRRLYLSNSAPHIRPGDKIPEGSIGIGW